MFFGLYIYIYIERERERERGSARLFVSLELRVQFCLLVCCTYASLSTVNKEKNRTDQPASLQVDMRETQQNRFCKIANNLVEGVLVSCLPYRGLFITYQHDTVPQ